MPDKIAGPIGFVTYSGFALVLLANSGDSVSIMTPLFADLKPVFVLICLAAAVTAAILIGSLANSRPSSRDATPCRKDR